MEALALMNALREELAVEDSVTGPEPRVARIEGDVAQLNSRLAGVEVDLRKSMDQKLDKVDSGFDKVDARFDRVDARFDRLEGRLDAVLEKLDGKADRLALKIDRVDTRFERKLEAFTTRRFTLWITVLSSAATMAAAVLAVIFGH